MTKPSAKIARAKGRLAALGARMLASGRSIEAYGARYFERVFSVLLKLFLKAFPRPTLADADKNRSATVLSDYFGIAIIYTVLDFAVNVTHFSKLGIQNYALYVVVLFVIRHHAVAGRLVFSMVLYVASVIYFYLLVSASIQYFEHLQASNMLLVVAFSTVTMGPLVGFWALLTSLALFWFLRMESASGALSPLSVMMPDVAVSYRHEWRVMTENLIEIYLFCWLVRSHIFSQLRNSLIREKEEAANAATARAAADKAERLKTQYLVHVNHELRNPLTAIVTSVDMLSKEYSTTALDPDSGSANKLSSRAGYFINTIRTTSRHVLSMLNDVLDMERLEGDDVPSVDEPFSVRRLIQEVAEIYSISASEAGSTISTRVASGMFDVWLGPASRIRQVLLNLVSNAIKHAPMSGIVISASQSDQGVLFEVSDNGPGLSDHASAHLFEPFASSLGASGSTGLGLRICKLIVERQLKGSIEVLSERGKGTKFTVVVPLKRDESSPTEWEYVEPASHTVTNPLDQASSGVANGLEGKSLLLIDDDADNLAVITMAFEDAGMTVKSAQTAQDALQILSSGTFDVTLLDHNLGPLSEFNGIELARKIVGGAAGAVVGYTGNYSEAVDRSWRAAGVMSIVRKPASMETLASTLLLASNAT